ncbi:neurogenic locus notch homolog protein 2-like [Mizuhopecten yessoensis]|uniref:neurogenic locus notch homolog protein 2-like n=1 Tax=Mizuhopecten yessoensis TaxID=6573 RepID=UPI000B458C27|nr:neurogenic locus notch homolog protein 2-like [Mizuhopecten yessoensis]
MANRKFTQCYGLWICVLLAATYADHIQDYGGGGGFIDGGTGGGYGGPSHVVVGGYDDHSHGGSGGGKTHCCDNADLINGRCVCKANYRGHSTHPCDKPCWDKCGTNSYCNVQEFKCYCKESYIGDPYYECDLPCGGKCASNAYCDSVTNTCRCNTGLIGDATKKCFSPSVIVFAQSSYTVRESVGVLKIKVNRQGGTFGSITVGWTVSSGTATSPSDFTFALGSLQFGNGDSVEFISIKIINDQDARFQNGDEPLYDRRTNPVRTQAYR